MSVYVWPAGSHGAGCDGSPGACGLNLPSSQQWKVTGVTSAENVKVTVWSVVSSCSTPGPERIVTTGGGATIHVYSSGVDSMFPAASTARRRSVCVPRVRSENCSGEVHEFQDVVESRAHSKVRSSAGVRLSLPVKVKIASWSSVPFSGPEVNSEFGSVTSGERS